MQSAGHSIASCGSLAGPVWVTCPKARTVSGTQCQIRIKVAWESGHPRSQLLGAHVFALAITRCLHPLALQVLLVCCQQCWWVCHTCRLRFEHCE